MIQVLKRHESMLRSKVKPAVRFLRADRAAQSESNERCVMKRLGPLSPVHSLDARWRRPKRVHLMQRMIASEANLYNTDSNSDLLSFTDVTSFMYDTLLAANLWQIFHNRRKSCPLTSTKILAAILHCETNRKNRRQYPGLL